MTAATAGAGLLRLCALLLGIVAAPLFSPVTGHCQQILSPQKLAEYRGMLPDVDYPHLQSILKDPTTIWYDHEAMPAAYQHATGNGYVPTTFHWPGYNISGDPTDRPLGHGRGGNANVEFPWSMAPGGAHASPYVKSFKGMWLPKKENGQPWPVVWFRQDVPARGERIISGRPLMEGRPSRFNRGYGWVFPVGTTFIEALASLDPQGDPHVFELRFRIRESDAWGVELFRPYPKAQDLADAIKERWPNWSSDPVRRSAVANLEGQKIVQRARLADFIHKRERAFDRVGGVDKLPRMYASDVNVLLDGAVFRSALGEAWREDVRGIEALAPSNSENRHNIVPYRYMGTFVGNDRKSCMSCHESTNVHATVFQHPRGWYGRVRGSDGILSWHPISLGSISRNGSSVRVQFRGEFVRGGIVEKFDPQKHPKDQYARIRGLL